MDSQCIKEILYNRGVRHLYHANTVLTALSYLRAGGLLSRQETEKRRLPQSGQKTDELDQIYEIYNDVFFDSVDIHARAKNVSHYGPVMFVYNLDVLDELGSYDIAVTKCNPDKWQGDLSYADKYFASKKELYSGFVLGDFGQHITVRNLSIPISFDHLEKILIESPGMHTKHLTLALQEIQKTLDLLGIDIPIEIRACSKLCRCQSQYNSSAEGYTYYRFATQL